MGPRPGRGKPTPCRPDTDSAETRQRILEIARASFAFGGYDGSTNRQLAASAGITSGALYHYFGSKLALYLAVHEDVQQRVYGQFTEAADLATGFLAKFDAVLDVAHELNEADPTFAAFLGAVRTDMRRHPEIAEALEAVPRRYPSVDHVHRTVGVEHVQMGVEFRRPGILVPLRPRT